MPVIGYKHLRVEGFPEIAPNQPFQTATQLTLPDLGDDTLHSIVRYLGPSEHSAFHKFHVEHETLRSLRVRFQNIQRDQVIAIIHFNMFRSEEQGHFWVGTKNKHAMELFANVQTTHPHLTVQSRNVDLMALRQQARDVSGGWFKDLQLRGVRAAGIFGPGVGESDEWTRYEQAGDLSAVTLDFMYRGDHHSAMVTKDGGIVVYANFTEEDQLRFLEEVNKAVKPVSTPVEPVSLARWRQS